MRAAAIIYAVAMIFFSIAFVAEWIRFRKQVRKYLKYGLWFSGLVIAMDLLAATTASWTWNPELTCLELVTILRLTAFTVVGIYYAARLGYPSFPLLLQKFKPAADEEVPAPVAPVEVHAETAGETDSSQLKVAPTSSFLEEAGIPLDGTIVPPTPGLPDDIHWKNLLLVVFGAGALTILYSSILFLLTSPQSSELAQEVFGISSTPAGDQLNLAGVLVLLEFAIAEEIIFRLGIQNFLARYMRLESRTYWIAILLTSTLWTLGHAGVLEPEWVKYAQIFPIGLLLGWLCKKYGAGSAMLVHAIFNLGFSFLYISLMK
jgi:membrane protease YdiL (CAAX protease family)